MIDKILDKIGRKPVILIGTCGIALSTMCFGLSSSLTDLLVSRAIGVYVVLQMTPTIRTSLTLWSAGVFGGTVSVVQSMVGEITDGKFTGTV